MSDDATLSRRRLLAGAALAGAAGTVSAISRASDAQASSPGVTQSIRDHGAKGDGAHDDGPAFTRALAALAGAGGGTLLVPDGEYTIASPVEQDFLKRASAIVIRGSGSAARIVPKVGDGATAFRFANIDSIMLDELTLHGTPASRTDAKVCIEFDECTQATIRGTSFYGVSSITPGGAVVRARASGLRIDRSAFRGCTGSTAYGVAVIENDAWRSLVVTDSDFIDWGWLNGTYHSKTHFNLPDAWIRLGNTAPLDDATDQAVVSLERLRLDEGGWRAIAVTPDRSSSHKVAHVAISGLRINGNGIDDGRGIEVRHTEHVAIADTWIGYSGYRRDAIYLAGVDRATIDNCHFTAGMDAIYADDATRSLTVRDTVYRRLTSNARSTTVVADGVTATLLRAGEKLDRGDLVRWGEDSKVVRAAFGTPAATVAGVALDDASPQSSTRVASRDGSLVTLRSDGSSAIRVNDALGPSPTTPGRVRPLEVGAFVARAVAAAPAVTGAEVPAQLVSGESGVTAPSALTLSGAWRPSGPAPTYRRDGAGAVHLSGAISGGRRTAGTVVARLPAGFRPPVERRFTAACGKQGMVHLLVAPNGEVRIGRGAMSPLSLDGVAFFV